MNQTIWSVGGDKRREKVYVNPVTNNTNRYVVKYNKLFLVSKHHLVFESPLRVIGNEKVIYVNLLKFPS